jgi:hypothetical protein
VVQAWDSTGHVFKTPINIKANLVPLTGLVPVLTVTPKTGLPPLTVTASTAQSLGTVSASKIDFGDGTVVNASTGTHTYSAKGNFRITATVTDSLGNSKTTAATVSATPPLPPPPSPGSVVTIYSPASSQSGSPIHVIADTSSSASTVAMVVYLDNSPVFTTAGRNLDTFVNTGSGTHVVMVQAWGRPNAGDQLSCLASARTSVTVP